MIDPDKLEEVTRFKLNGTVIESISYQETWEEFFEEKWYNRLAISLAQKDIYIRKWWLRYSIDIDFKTMGLKWIKNFY